MVGAVRNQARTEALTPPADGLGSRILLAEDDGVNRKVAVRLLEKQGHRVTTAGNGREAVELFRKERFDLILMDVQMPGLDGLGAARETREFERTTGGRIPIIALTAHALTGDRERCLGAGMDSYVTEPIRAAQLFTAIQRLVGDGVPSETV